MQFLRKKKGSKSTSADATSQLLNNDDSVAFAVNGSSSSIQKSKSKFGRKNRSNPADISSIACEQQVDDVPVVGPLGANPINIPPPQNPTKRSNPSSQTLTTASTSNTSRSSSVGVLFDDKSKKQTNALQQRQMSYMQRVGSINDCEGGVGPNNKGTFSPQHIQHQKQSQSQPTQQQSASNQKKDQQQNKQGQDPFALPLAQPMTRSGWSMVSNTSTAMNSVQYIESLDNLPDSPEIRGKHFPILNSQSDERIRSALSRPFGRTYFPPSYRPKFEISIQQPPSWDVDEKRYKYKINIVRLPSAKRQEGVCSSYITATTTRSLQDFVWLERALRAEYHGAMLVPLLSLALYFNTTSNNNDEESIGSNTTFSEDGSRKIPADGNVISQSIVYLEDKMDKNEAVEASVLANWLSDIFNGVRGSGELLLQSKGDISESEAVETFLFRHTELLNEPSRKEQLSINSCRASGLGSPFNLFSILSGDVEDRSNKSLFDDFLDNPFDCFGSETAHRQDSNKLSISNMCASGSTGVLGIKGCNSNLSMSSMDYDFAEFLMSSSAIATHSELLEAERDLIASYIRSTTLAMTKMQALTKDEAYVGQCWKRLATALNDLFSVEKDLETAYIGDQIKSNKKNQPFRKLRKTVVDDGLRILARAKINRSRPSLANLKSMMNAYYADLNSIVPAFKEYRDSMNELHGLGGIASVSNVGRYKRGNTDDWTASLKVLTTNIAKHLTGSGEERTFDCDVLSEDGKCSINLNTTQSKALQARVLANERMLKYSITSLCKTCPIRTTRMAWWFMKLEVKQASRVRAAATALKQTLSIDTDSSLTMKIQQNEEEESKANDAEIELVKRILDLGNQDEDNIDYTDIEVRKQHALRMVLRRVGRWNAETALAIMETAGITDAEIQMDETSRELRHVRKFAISLRENVNRCREAAEALAVCFIRTHEYNPTLISRSRQEFWAAISTVFSGRLIADQDQDGIAFPSARVLSAVGIPINDKGGWLDNGDESKNQRRRSCGEVARRYLKKRDNQANILISRVIKLLNEYEQRLEGIESFVYMHCVGIQLEKHCSKRRAKALSAWEKRTDISTAINVATKKRIPKLVQELKVKLDALPQVSHTTVIKAKESHLASKTLKAELHKLANNRFGRAQEVSTERVISIINLWAKHEESVAIEEVRALDEAVQEVELSVEREDIEPVIDGTRNLHTDIASEGRTSEGRTLLI